MQCWYIAERNCCGNEKSALFDKTRHRPPSSIRMIANGGGRFPSYHVRNDFLEQKGYGHVEISCVGLLQDKVVR